jgi:hypothetical protein
MGGGRRVPRTRAPLLGFALAAAAALAVAFGTRHALHAALTLRETFAPERDTMYMPRASVLRALGLGHHEMLADLIAARANVYFGGALAGQADPRRLEQALSTALELDPRFHRLYLRSAAMLVYSGGPLTVESFLGANRLLARGAAIFPGDWELPFQRGFNLFYELPRLCGEDDPRVPGWRQEGIEALRQATLLDGVPSWLPNLVARMLTREGGEELAIHHLEQAYAHIDSPQTRTEIARRLGELLGHRRAAAVEEAARTLAREVAERYPYAPEAFSLVAGPRRLSGPPADPRQPATAGTPDGARAASPLPAPR